MPPSKNGLDATEGFDAFLEDPTTGEIENEKTKKRAREDSDDEEENDKKLKEAVDLEEELTILASTLPVTYTLKNTPSQASSSQTIINFTVNSVSFSLTIHDRTQYESRSGPTKFSFQTTQKPDSLSPLIADYLIPSASSRVTDIVKVLVNSLT